MPLKYSKDLLEDIKTEILEIGFEEIIDSLRARGLSNNGIKRHMKINYGFTPDLSFNEKTQRNIFIKPTL